MLNAIFFFSLVKIILLKNLCLFLLLAIFLLSCTKEVKTNRTVNNLYFDKAFEYRDTNVPDSAFYYFNRAKELFIQQNDSVSAGKCLVNMGIISAYKGDLYGAQELSLNAISYFNQQTADQNYYIHANYNNLGIATQNLENYHDALKFYSLAIEASTDSLDIRLYLNNQAKTYQLLDNYNAALTIYDRILKGTSKNKKEYARALTNVASTRWLLHKTYNPLPDLKKSLKIRLDEQDLWGLNSSYAHLSDVYASKSTDSALKYAKQMFQTAKKIDSPVDQLTAIKKLILLSPATDIKQYFQLYNHLSDSLTISRQRAKNQFALIRYQTEKHKADFLKSQTENVRKQNNIFRQNVILGSLIAIILFGIYWYSRRKKGFEQEREIQVKNTEIKYVKKIHDRVANKVYQVMSEIENTDQVNRDNLLDKLEVLYNISRDISYENEQDYPAEGFPASLSKMLKSYASGDTEVLIVGNESAVWDLIDELHQSELYCVLQELMTNMKKHSKATSVMLRFEIIDGALNLLYADNGIGINKLNKQNGLTNTENRIESIGASITFETTHNTGLQILILCPLL